MKLECEITAVKGNGETLQVTLQGSEKNAAAWRRMGVQSIEIAESPRSQRAFHLGRRVSITVEPISRCRSPMH